MNALQLVAEVSSNHSGDPARAHAFVETAAAIGCSAVGFQQFRIDRLFTPQALAARPELASRRTCELPETFSAELAAHAHALGIRFTSTPYYLDAIRSLEPHVDFFTIAAEQILWLELLRELARTRKPLLLATNMATMEEVERAVETLTRSGCGRLLLLHGVSSHPTPPEEANLAAIETLRRHFGLPVGWSDHTTSREVVWRAIDRFGAELVDLHLDLDRTGDDYRFGHCWLPSMVRDLLCQPWPGARDSAHLAMDGDGSKEPRRCETPERRWRADPTDGLRPLLDLRRELLAARPARSNGGSDAYR